MSVAKLSFLCKKHITLEESLKAIDFDSKQREKLLINSIVKLEEKHLLLTDFLGYLKALPQNRLSIIYIES